MSTAQTPEQLADWLVTNYLEGSGGLQCGTNEALLKQTIAEAIQAERVGDRMNVSERRALRAVITAFKAWQNPDTGMNNVRFRELLRAVDAAAKARTCTLTPDCDFSGGHQGACWHYQAIRIHDGQAEVINLAGDTLVIHDWRDERFTVDLEALRSDVDLDRLTAAVKKP